MNPELNEPLKKRIFRLGDTVRVLSDPFADFTGKVNG